MAAVQSASSPTSTAAIGAKVDAGRTRLAENFEMFLTLLTTQLKNQDPLSPMDGNQFTQQLVQMTSVEQQLLSNDLLRQIAGKGDDKFTRAVDLIGKGVTIQSADATLSSEGATWSYDLPTAAKTVDFQVRNARGELVWEKSASSVAAGRHQAVWDGKIDGKLAPAGVYTLAVKATDSKDAAIAAKTFVDGLVTGVEQKGEDILLSIGRSTVPLSSVQSVWMAATPGAQATGS